MTTESSKPLAAWNDGSSDLDRRYYLPPDCGDTPKPTPQHPPQDAPDVAALVARLNALADYFSPPSGAGTDHAISCDCHKCEWADDLREAARVINKQDDRITELFRENTRNWELEGVWRIVRKQSNEAHARADKAEASLAKATELLRDLVRKYDVYQRGVTLAVSLNPDDRNAALDPLLDTFEDTVSAARAALAAGEGK